MQPFIKTMLFCLLFSGKTGYAEQTASTRTQEGPEITEIAPPPPEMESSGEEWPPAGFIELGESSIKDPETGEWKPVSCYVPQPKKLSDLYLDGGYVWMSLITLCLIAMLFAVWKAPRWVKEIGLAALVLSTIYFMTGLYSISNYIGQGGAVGISADMLIPILLNGFRVALIAPIYGLIVYGLSLILRIAVKPRI